MEKISRADLVDAAVDLNKVIKLDPELDVKLGAAQLREQVVEAIMLLSEAKGDLEKIAAGTRVVVCQLRDEVIGAVPKTRETLVTSMTEAGRSPAEIEAEAGKDVDEVVARVTATLDAVAELIPVAADPTKPAAAGKKSDAPKKRATPTVKLGKFEPVRPDSQLGKILAAYLDGRAWDGPLANVSLARQATGISSDKVVAVLKRARVSNGIDFDVGMDGSLTISLPRGVTAETVWRRPKEKPKANGSAPRAAPPVGAFKLIRRGSRMHRFVEMAEAGKTLDQIARASGRADFAAKDVKWWLCQYARRHHGIGCEVDEAGVAKLILPAGKALADCVTQP